MTSPERHPIKAPTWSMVLFRSLFILTITGFSFAAYSLIRPLFGTFGFEFNTFIKSAGAVLVLGIFVVWLMPMVDLHIGIFEHVIPGRRFKRGLCARCAHPRAPHAATGFCAECGRQHGAPEGWRLKRRTILNFVLWLTVGLFFGSAIGETRLTLDERKWIQECRILEDMSPESLGFRARRRSWPSSYSELYYKTEQGPYAEPLVTNERVRRIP